MPLDSGQMPFMQARSGLMRSGASRAGWFHPNVVIVIDGIDRSSKVDARHTRIHVALNDEPDTASFVLTLNAGFTPTAGQAVSIGLGTAKRREFAGQISRVTVSRLVELEQPLVTVECIDWGKLLDRQLITYAWPTVSSASIIAAEIVDGWTTGFTRNNIAPDLPSVNGFAVVNKTPSEALRLLANRIPGGATYTDTFRDVHFFDVNGEPREVTAPLQLTDSLTTWKTFSHRYEQSQIRSRVIVEGDSTRVSLVSAPAGVTSVPIDDEGPFTLTSPPNYARIGNQSITYDFIAGDWIIFAAEGRNRPGTTVAVEANPGDTELIVVDTVPLAGASDWLRVGNQMILKSGSGSGPNRFTGIPAVGYGSIQTAIAVGTAVVNNPSLDGIPSSGEGAILVDQPAGSEVRPRIIVDDLVAQPVLAAIEGEGDGVHERVISAPGVTQAEAIQIAIAELVAFSNALLVAEWVTFDMNAKVGRPQSIDVGGLFAILTILSSDITFPVPNYRPQRSCEASTVKVSRLMDVVTRER